MYALTCASNAVLLKKLTQPHPPPLHTRSCDRHILTSYMYTRGTQSPGHTPLLALPVAMFGT